MLTLSWRPWEYHDEAAYDIIGGELVLPRLLGVRLRELRSVVAAQARLEVLDEIYLELKKARSKYKDYTEEYDDGLTMLERFVAAIDEENYVHSDIIQETQYSG